MGFCCAGSEEAIVSFAGVDTGRLMAATIATTIEILYFILVGCVCFLSKYAFWTGYYLI